MVKGYDNIGVNREVLLDLTYEEGVGVLAHDRARPVRRAVTLNGPPAWIQTPLANLTVLDFNGNTDYLECDAVDTIDLDFTTDDYTLAAWVNWTDTFISQIVMGRYELDVSGWELYLTRAGIDSLTLRHHHGSLGPDVRDGCYSAGWTPGQWWLIGVTRQKVAGTSYPLHYRNGALLTVTYDVGGLKDPDTSGQDLVIGTRYTKNTNWYKGQMWRPRIWSRCLSAFEMSMMFEMERSLFGV